MKNVLIAPFYSKFMLSTTLSKGHFLTSTLGPRTSVNLKPEPLLPSLKSVWALNFHFYDGFAGNFDILFVYNYTQGVLFIIIMTVLCMNNNEE